MQPISLEARAVEMFERGETAKRVADRLRIKKEDAMAMKMEWLTAKQAKNPPKKAEKPAPKKKAKPEA